MATIALIWELGSDYGHIGRLLPIALALREKGHRPVLLLRDISRADEMLGPYGLDYLQAPLWLPPVKGLPPPVNFTETLFLFGFLNPSGLLSVARAWRKLWDLLQPNLLVFDQAPTALLAARGLGIPRMITGNSFAVPPRAQPLPPYRWWEAPPPALRLAESEAKLLDNANRVLTALAAPSLKRAGDLYEAEATLITGVKELDVYGPRAPEFYCGAINSLQHGVEPRWPRASGPRVFAYLKRRFPVFERVLTILSRAQACSLVFAPGMARQQAQRFQNDRLNFSDKPVLMARAREECDLAICHAGGTVDVMLEAGKPVWLLPMQMEQMMTSRRAEQQGCALALYPDPAGEAPEAQFARLLHDKRFRERARDYAAKHAHYSPETSLNTLIARCEALLGGG